MQVRHFFVNSAPPLTKIRPGWTSSPASQSTAIDWEEVSFIFAIPFHFILLCEMMKMEQDADANTRLSAVFRDTLVGIQQTHVLLVCYKELLSPMSSELFCIRYLHSVHCHVVFTLYTVQLDVIAVFNI